VNVAGTQASVEWQALQASLVGMWFVPLPVAIAPSWQLAQVPTTWVWSTRVAGFHVAKAWQDSHVLLLAMCAVGLP
jgi:Na+-transporting NADH:ubiquinone oxidoreductase subunit NqrB